MRGSSARAGVVGGLKVPISSAPDSSRLEATNVQDAAN
jgi:hypothetical protein